MVQKVNKRMTFTFLGLTEDDQSESLACWYTIDSVDAAILEFEVIWGRLTRILPFARSGAN